MAFTRKMLKAYGIEDNIIEQIMDAHVEVVEGIKTERDTFKTKADQLDGVQRELDDLKKNGGDWQKKYEDEHSAFETYKNAQTVKETKAAKEKAYRALLKEAGIADRRIDTILKVTNLEEIELDENGKIKDSDKHTETVKAEYPEFIETTTQRGAHVEKPPAGSGSGGTKTKEEILAIKDGVARRQAMAENPALFGIAADK